MVMGEPSPLSIAREFVRQYYTLLNKEPQSMRRFYSEDSYFIHGGIDDESDSQEVYGLQAIDEHFKRSNFVHCKTKIRHVDAQLTIDSGLVIQVSGELSKYAQPMRRFVQTFVLAMKIPCNYYLRNDIFRYQDDVTYPDGDEGNSDFVPENQNDLIKGQINQPVQQFPTQVTKQPPSAPPIVDEVPKDQPHHQGFSETNKGPLLNGGHEHQGEIVSQARHVEVSGTLTNSQPPKSPQGNSEEILNNRDQPNTAPQATKGASGSTETESSEDSADEVQKEEAESANEKPEKANQQEPSPTVAEPLAQGPPTYANLVKSGPTSAAAHGPVVTKQAPTTGATSSSVGSTPGTVSASGGPPPSREFKDSNTGYGGHNHGTGKFQRNRPSIGNQRGASGPGGRDRDRDRDRDRERDRDRDRDRFYQNNDGPNQDGQDRRRTIGGMGSNNVSSYPDTQQVFVGNLPHNCTEEDLEKLFSKFGKVVDVRISGKGTGQSKTTASGQRVPNFGFVVFVDEKSVTTCLSKRPILLEEKHRLNVETKKNKPMRNDNQNDQMGSGQNRGSQEHLGNIGRNSERPRGGPRGPGGQRGVGGPGNVSGGGGAGSERGGGNTGSRSGGRGSQDGSRSGIGGGDSRTGQSGGPTRTYQRRS